MTTTIEEGLKAYIEAQVSGIGKGYPIDVPQDADYPAFAYQTIDDDELLAHDGPTGFVSARIQISIVAKDTDTSSGYGASKALANSLRAKLDGFQGNMNGVQVDYCKTTAADDWAEIHQLPVQSVDVILRYQR